MMTIDRYIAHCRWSHNGMEFPHLSCYGLVRLARQELFGLPALPSLAHMSSYDKRAATMAARAITHEHMNPCEPQPGAMAICWRGRLCMHVGLVVEVDGRLSVLDIDEGRGACITPLAVWQRRYLRVDFYAD